VQYFEGRARISLVHLSSLAGLSIDNARRKNHGKPNVRQPMLVGTACKADRPVILLAF
jgi:hypothetical protein